MIYSELKKIAYFFIDFYQNLSPANRNIINTPLFFIKNKLRSYYTLPKDKTTLTPIDSTIFFENKKDFEILKSHYLNETIRNKTNSVTGYIPYLKSQTSIYFYHFFSINYGLRKTLIGQLSLIDEKDVIKKVSVIKFPTRFNGVINLEEVFGEAEGVSCLLEIYHPRILINHAGSQGHLRFWGIYGNYFSTVHSMPLFPFIVKNDKSKYAERRFFPKGKLRGELYFYNTNLKSRTLYENLEGDLYLLQKDKIGYTIQLEKNKTIGKKDYPTSIWHHAPIRRKSFLTKNDLIKQQQIIPFPEINNIDCQLFFGEYIIDNQEVELILFNSNYKNGLTKSVIIDISVGIQISKIFNIKDLKGSYILVKPKINNGKNLIDYGYINIQYIVDNTRCDGVHSQPFTSDSNLQGLKFMHYKIDKFCNSYIYVSGLINSILEFRVRIIDSKNQYEKCFNLKIEKNDNNLLKNLKDFGINNSSGIVQIECDKYNPNASLYTHNSIDGKSFFSACHLTGG